MAVTTPVQGQLTSVTSKPFRTVAPPLPSAKGDTSPSVSTDVLLTEPLCPAPGSCVAWGTLTLVVGSSIGRGAGASILTRIVVTVPRVKITVLTSEVCGAVAEVVVLLVHTFSTILAGIVSTVININLTISACESLLTDTVIQRVVLIGPTLSLYTGLHSTRGRVKLTVSTLEPRLTITSEVAGQVYTGASILTKVSSALIVISLTISLLLKPFVTDTAVVVDLVHTDGVTGAGVGLTFIDLCLTICPIVTWEAFTSVVVVAVNTGPSIETGLSMALIYINLTVKTSKAWFTFTGVGSKGVSTGASVLTRVIHGALINIILTVSGGVSWVASTGVGTTWS